MRYVKLQGKVFTLIMTRDGIRDINGRDVITTSHLLSVVVYTCNPSIQRLRQEDSKFKASLSYVVRTCLKNRSRGALIVYILGKILN